MHPTPLNFEQDIPESPIHRESDRAHTAADRFRLSYPEFASLPDDVIEQYVDTALVPA